MSGTGMVVPVRVLYAQQQGASLAIIGAMATSFLVSNFLFQYPLGWLADRWGRKRIMLIGLVGQAVVSLLYLGVADPALFVGLRLVEGIFSATMLPPAKALIADTIPPDQRGAAYGVFNAFFNASFLLGPGLGVLLGSFGYAPVFIGAAVGRVLALVVVALVIHETPRRHPAESTRARPLAAPRVILAAAAGGLYPGVRGLSLPGLRSNIISDLDARSPGRDRGDDRAGRASLGVSRRRSSRR